MSLFELYKFSFLKQGVSHSCHVDKLSVPIFSAPRKDTSGISDPKITLELLFSDSTLDNLQSASHSKEGSGKRRDGTSLWPWQWRTWDHYITSVFQQAKTFTKVAISKQNRDLSCFQLFALAAQRRQKVKCVVRLWHQVVHCCAPAGLSLARDDSQHSSRRRFITF